MLQGWEASVGYHLAGYTVIGVDIEPQKNYPYEFHQMDAFEFIERWGGEFHLLHASPRLVQIQV